MVLLTGGPAINAGGGLTTLPSAISSSAVNIVVVTGATIASIPGSYVIQIDSEEMLVGTERQREHTHRRAWL